jgi:hypothetical protein
MKRVIFTWKLMPMWAKVADIVIFAGLVSLVWR